LERDLDVDAVAGPREQAHVRVNRRLRLVEVLDEGNDAALVEELVRLLVAFCRGGDAHPAVEERELALSLGEEVEAEVGGLEDQGIGLEGDLRPALAR